MTPQELNEYQRKLVAMLYGGRKEDTEKRRYWQACHLVFGNGSEQTRRECEAMTEDEKLNLLRRMCETKATPS
jgi:hypothetical protein